MPFFDRAVVVNIFVNVVLEERISRIVNDVRSYSLHALWF